MNEGSWVHDTILAFMSYPYCLEVKQTSVSARHLSDIFTTWMIVTQVQSFTLILEKDVNLLFFWRRPVFSQLMRGHNL